MRKNFPLRIDAEVLDAVRRWADDDLRSLNGQIEFLLRDALRQRGRLNGDQQFAEQSASQPEEQPKEQPTENDEIEPTVGGVSPS